MSGFTSNVGRSSSVSGTQSASPKKNETAKGAVDKHNNGRRSTLTLFEFFSPSKTPSIPLTVFKHPQTSPENHPIVETSFRDLHTHESDKDRIVKYSTSTGDPSNTIYKPPEDELLSELLNSPSGDYMKDQFAKHDSEFPNISDRLEVKGVAGKECEFPGDSDSDSFKSTAAGSVNKSSDRDYVISQQKLDPTKGATVKTKSGLSTEFNTYRPQQTINRYKNLREQANKLQNQAQTKGQNLDTSIYSYKGDVEGYNNHSLESRQNAMNILASHDFNWFTVLKKDAELAQKQKVRSDWENGTIRTSLDEPPALTADEKEFLDKAVWDVRNLEIELTHALTAEIRDDCENLSETDMVIKLNEGFRDIFGKEAGIVFDTNFYSAHAVLKAEPSDQNMTPEDKQDYDRESMKMAYAKSAIHFEGGKADFIAFSKEMSGVSEDNLETIQLIEDAWTLKEERKQNIEEESVNILREMLTSSDQTIPNGIPDRFKADLLSQINDGSSIDDILMSEVGETLLQSEEIQMMASNKLYTNYMTETQSITNQLAQTTKEIEELQRSLTGEVSSEDKAQIMKAISDLKTESSRLTKEEKKNNMRQLLYANEPYFSGDTIQVVVGGIQIFKGNMASASSTYGNINSSQACLASAIENVGDGIVKEFSHMSHKDNLERFVIKGSKYLSRAYFSLNHGILRKEQEKGESVDASLKQKVTRLNDFNLELVKYRSDPKLKPSEQDDKALKLFEKNLDLFGLDQKIKGNFVSHLSNGKTPLKEVFREVDLIKDTDIKLIESSKSREHPAQELVLLSILLKNQTIQTTSEVSQVFRT